MLEFDCETALLQSAFLCMQQRYGKDVASMDRETINIYRPVLCQTYKDVLQIRKEEKVNVWEAEHKNRKLVLGMLYSILRRKYNWNLLKSEFESFDHVYPEFNWNHFLMFVDVFQWNSCFHEIISKLDAKLLVEIYKETIPYMSNDFSSGNCPILLAEMLNTLLMPSTILKLNTFPDSSVIVIWQRLVDDLLESIDAHFSKGFSDWKQTTKNKFLCALISCIKTIHFHSETTTQLSESDLESDLISDLEVINDANLDTFYKKILERRSITVVQRPSNSDMFTSTLIKCAQTCFDLFVAVCNDDWHRCNALRGTENPERGILATDMTMVIEELNETLKDSHLVLDNENLGRQVLRKILLRIHQHIIRTGITDGKAVEKVVDLDLCQIIDYRLKNYEDAVSNLIICPDLVYDKSKISCLDRNANLLSVKDCLEMVAQIRPKNLSSPNVEALKLVIIRAYSQWSESLQQQFYKKYLKTMMDLNILKTSSFSKDLTMLFNKLTTSGNARDETISNFNGLCLQSTSSAIAAAISHAVNNDSQSKIIVKLLSSVAFLCKHRSSESSTCSNLCSILKNQINFDKLTDNQLGNLKTLLRNLFELAVLEKKTKSYKGAILDPVEFLHQCILPFLDQWIPGEHPTATLTAIQLLEMCVKIKSPKTLNWLKDIRPIVLLCYLGTMLYQCKIVCRNENSDWVPLKTSVVSILDTLTHYCLKCSDFVSEKELKWLVSRFRNHRSEAILFYYVDIMELYHLDIDFRGTNDPLAYLLEFAACNEKNATVATVWFKQIANGYEKRALAHIVSSLVKVLPFFLLSEWKNIIPLLKECLQSNSIRTNIETISMLSEECKLLLRLFSILEDSIVLSATININIAYLLNCFTVIVTDTVTNFLTIGSDDEIDYQLPAEVLIRTCHFLKKLHPYYLHKGRTLLLEMARLCKKESQYIPRKTISKVNHSLMLLPSQDLQNVIRRIVN